MHLIVGGCRGTNPVPESAFLEFGGETTAFLVEGAAGERVLLDAGTGIRRLGRRLTASAPAKSVLLLMSHYHLDHITGLPSLGLIYQQDWTIDMAAPLLDGRAIEEVMPRLLEEPFWPLQVEDLASNVRFGTLADGPHRRGGLEIRWTPLHHPGGCTAYRLDEPATGASIVIATDVEWAASTPAEQERLRRLCSEPRPAALLVMDGQYTPDEYPRHRGWGHSVWTEAVALAQSAGVPRVAITHHSPTRDDAALALLEREARARSPLPIDWLREGALIDPLA